jgi:hypothetical protein
MKNIRLFLFAAILFSLCDPGFARNYPTKKSGPQQKNETEVKAEGCLPAASFTEISINNVRARINTGGDMWWDLQGTAQYFIPKNTTKTSMFSAALWVGGLDVNGQLKLAAQRYRSEGNDYFTGPLNNDGTASITAETCDKYDRHFVINRADVESFIAAYNETGGSLSGYEVPNSIKNYPGNGDPESSQSHFLAPYVDVDGNGYYNYQGGDYPYYDFDNKLCPKSLPIGTIPEVTPEGNGRLVDQVLKGDQTIWWVFNDKGNIHSETKGAAIGLEIRAQAFGFATNDEINNMTFYSYEIINRSTYRLTQTYFSQWVDTDLGYASDDFVGCDVKRGLGYCYNGTDVDGTGKPGDYGAQPPAVGVDFFQGPYMDADGIDNPRFGNDGKLLCGLGINGVNFGDSIVDNERLGMVRFVYHNREDAPFWPVTDPQIAPEYYNMLRGIWKDGTKMRYGGNAHFQNGGIGPECLFMFPDDSDPWGLGTGCTGIAQPTWNERTAGNTPFDRRFMQSAGPFTLEAGAVNYITVGIPWARASAGGPWASVRLLQQVDDKCQTLFDNCFKILDGPDAPDMAVQELDREIILYLTNRKTISNNFTVTPEDYAEVDPNIVFPDTMPASLRGDSLYRFEGYKIYQVKDASVSIADIEDADLSRLVAQCDVQNKVSKLVNFYYNDVVGASVPKVEVDGANKGIVHSFRIFEDQFATGDKRLINHKQYYYIAIAYAFNEFKKFDPNDIMSLDGQKQPYKAGRKAATGGIKVLTAIPHISSPEAGGTIINAEYGAMPKISRIEGQGNGGLIVDLTQESIDQIMSGSPYTGGTIEYDYNAGPLNIKVVDPLNIDKAAYTIKFLPPTSGNVDSSSWVLTNTSTGATYNSEASIKVANEQLLLDIGLAVTISQTKFPGDLLGENAGFLESTIAYADSSKQWLWGIPDNDSYADLNWIHSGTVLDKTDDKNSDYYKMVGNPAAEVFVDPNEEYENLIGGTWAPYRLSSKYENGPAYDNAIAFPVALDRLNVLASVDVIITSDQSKWTRCPVIEECEDVNAALSEGHVKKFDLRYGQTNGEAGMGWFPGYAINIETGERLNMMFGEDSWLANENGRDMLWNPTGNIFTPLGQLVLGGKHWIYIFGHNGDTPKDCPAYDQGVWAKTNLLGDFTKKREVYRNLMWVGSGLVNPNFAFNDPANIPSDVKIRLRVTRPYAQYYATSITGPTTPQNNNYPMYGFSTENMATQTGNTGAAEGALDLINVVPNPYFAYSDYEINQLDNRIKVTNLPDKCTVTIYTVGGTLIRQYKKDDPKTSLDWDLKNSAGIPIAGGLYLIHVKVEGVGEKVVKWFGSLRPIDLNSF